MFEDGPEVAGEGKYCLQTWGHESSQLCCTKDKDELDVWVAAQLATMVGQACSCKC